MAETQVKRRRKRLTTPPPDETSTDVADVYDESVSSTFNNLLTGNVEVSIESTSSTHNLSPTSQLDEHADVVNLDDSDLQAVDAEVDLALATQKQSTTEGEEPPSPPPPAQMPSKPHRLNNGTRAALNKLVEICSQTEEVCQETDNQDLGCSPVVVISNSIKVRVRMPSGIERYQMKLTDRLQHLRQSVATRECTEVSKISLFFNDYAIAEDDTVKSLGLTVADTIEAYILSEPQQLPSSSSTITIKVQGKGGYRDFVNVAMHDDEPMSVLMEKYAEEKKVGVSKLTFYFDGEELSKTDTPLSLDIEDGDCVDVSQ